jgi:hypothetical protein
VPWTGQGHGNAGGTAGEGLDECPCARTADVEVEDTQTATSAIGDPTADNDVEVLDLGELAQLDVVPETGDGEGGKTDVKELEDLVETVTERAPGLDTQTNEGDSSLKTTTLVRKGRKFCRLTYNETPHQERGLGRDHSLQRGEGEAALGHVSNGVSQGLEGDDATEPSVDQVVSVKRDAQQRNERVVPASEDEEGDLQDSISEHSM